jgi:hypothetical protein
MNGRNDRRDYWCNWYSKNKAKRAEQMRDLYQRTGGAVGRKLREHERMKELKN